MTFGEWLKEELDHRGLSMSAFAEQLGVSQPAVSNWVGGKRLPDVASAAKIARNLDVPINEVYSQVTQEIPVPQHEESESKHQLQGELDALIVERDELEQAQEQTRQRLEEVTSLIKELEERAAWLQARSVAGSWLGPSDKDIESFILSWDPDHGSDVLRLARMPKELQAAYAAGFDQGRSRGLREGLRARRSQKKRKSTPTGVEDQ